MADRIHPDIVERIMKYEDYPDETLDVIITLSETSNKNLKELENLGMIIGSRYNSISAVAAKIKTYNKGEKWLQKLEKLNYIKKVSLLGDAETLAG